MPVSAEDVVRVLAEKYPVTYDACANIAALRIATSMLGEMSQEMTRLQELTEEGPDDD